MHALVLIIDGLGDLPVTALGKRTPLEAAATPNLDRLANAGSCGLVDPIGGGELPSTNSGAGMLLGLAPEQAGWLQRGPVEAAGLGLPMRDGDVALRANFATLAGGADNCVVLDRRAGRIRQGAAELAAGFADVDLGHGVSAALHPTEQHRAALVLSGPGLDADITDTDPGDVALPVPLLPSRGRHPGAEFTAGRLNAFIRLAHEQLKDHAINRERAVRGLPPANGLITRGAGLVRRFDNHIVRAGLRAAVVTGCNTVRGLGRLFGFATPADPRFTGDIDTDLDAKLRTALDALPAHDLVFVHIKAPDVCAHDRQPGLKRDFLERLDTALSVVVGHELLLAVAADHTTDSNTGFHTADPVPALICSAQATAVADGGGFSERACRNGSMPRQTGAEFIRRVLARMHP